MGRTEIRIRPGAYFMAGLWLLVLPLSWVFGIALAASVHELGHFAAIWCCDSRIWAVEIGAYGAKIETEPLPPGQELWCALAGPMAGMLVCLLWRWWPEAAAAALVQTVFNLIPVYPMDGGRAWKALRNICCK